MANKVRFRAKRACTIVLNVAANRHMYLAANQVVLLPENYQSKHLVKMDGPGAPVEPETANEPYVVNTPTQVETPVNDDPRAVVEPDVEVTPGLTCGPAEAEKKSLAIQHGLDKLEKTNPSHWVKGGKVNTETFVKIVGFEVTQEEVEAACPGFGRECARG